jgi:membrane protein YdbS with pleckstrin-like domain
VTTRTEIIRGEPAPSPLTRLPVTIQPHENLLKYYLLSSLVFGPALLVAGVALYFKYRTLRYDIDDEGITMRWGILFRREISLTYARIQDIRLTSNVVERWFGLARIQLQTASGSSSAEMTIEGVPDVDGMRDFLYARMRGASGSAVRGAASPALGGTSASVEGASRPMLTAADNDMAVLTETLTAVADEVRALREEMAAARTSGGARG